MTARFSWPSFTARRLLNKPHAAHELVIQQAEEHARTYRQLSAEQLLREASDPCRAEPPPANAKVLGLFIEALRRTCGVVPYPCQLLGGLEMASGRVIEMATGEGKTFAAACAATLFACGGRRVHLATPNPYLAARDQAAMAPLFSLLGIQSALLTEGGSPAEKRRAYQAQVLYGSGYEFGFDFLRDRFHAQQRARLPLGERSLRLLNDGEAPDDVPIQQGHDCAVIDEIDSVLVDEACMPLVLGQAKSTAANAAAYEAARSLAATLNPQRDFELLPAERRVQLTPEGQQRCEAGRTAAARLQLNQPWRCYIEQALHARYVLRQGVDYVVQGSEVLIVDPYTGRICPGRRWKDGLHEAVEALQGVPIQRETTTALTISRQRYFRQYQTLTGLTGTTSGVEKEFRSLYDFKISKIPVRKPLQRVQLPDRFFATEAAKLDAIVDEVRAVSASGRPVLIGVGSIGNSLELSRMLQAVSLPHRVLNGVQDETEAAVVAQAGQPGAITIATQMAGRGTDIRLGEGVAELGGLHVIGAERHESRRVDDQLAGRAGRQGDPGSCRFFVSADDALLVRFGAAMQRQMQNAPLQQDEILQDFRAAVAGVQRQAEAAARQQRTELMAQDKWLDDLRAPRF